MKTNPLCWLANNGVPILELKVGLVLYLKRPPTITEISRVYDLYTKLCEDRINNYCSTAPGSIVQKWNLKARNNFEKVELPGLYSRQHWGYGFDDGKNIDSWLFMFHGYRAGREEGKASFFRFDFPWNVDTEVLLDFTSELIALISCLSGFCGYYFQSSSTNLVLAYSKMFAWSHRYLGVEAHNLDTTVSHMLNGYKCVNWLTIIGNKLYQANSSVVEDAKRAAYSHKETDLAILFQAAENPLFGDVNKQEKLTGYNNVAQALLPLQITEHKSFGGEQWTAENTFQYIQRFTH